MNAFQMAADNSMYPDHVCLECAYKLILFHKFRLKCESVNAEMTDIIERSQAVVETFHIEYVGQENDVTDKADEESVDEEIQTLALNTEDSIADEKEYNEVNDGTVIDSEDAIIEEDHLDVEELKYQISIEDEEVIFVENYSQHMQMDNETSSVAVLEPVKKKQNSSKHLDRECEQCGRKFSRKSTLDQHRVTHTGEKKFVCLQCDKHFTRHSHLMIHMRIHNNDKPYICEVCSRAFVKSSDLIRHRRIHSDARNYKCTICPKRFKRSTDVVTHLRSHTGAKPYSCNVCSKSYTSHSSLKKHILTHEQNKCKNWINIL